MLEAALNSVERKAHPAPALLYPSIIDLAARCFASPRTCCYYKHIYFASKKAVLKARQGYSLLTTNYPSNLMTIATTYRILSFGYCNPVSVLEFGQKMSPFPASRYETAISVKCCWTIGDFQSIKSAPDCPSRVL